MKSAVVFTWCWVFAILGIVSANSCHDISRSSWGARDPRPDAALPLPVKQVIIAHTVTPLCHTFSSCAARMRQMQSYHMDNQGFPDLGYNFVIGGDGSVYEGTGWRVEGSHTRGFNHKSVAIAFIGNFMTNVPTDGMLDAAKRLIICGIKKGYISQDRYIHGARDATCTQSPGDVLYAIIKRWPRFKGGPLPGYTC